MGISSFQTENLQSLQSTLSIAAIDMAIGQDAQSMTAMVEDMEQISKALERSVTPHKGGSIDIKL
ncbi:putative motility protein [Paramaledivibacter caminithermalis]|uniref:Putative motility protein n=1 Tax=Paramaledivibacter caminithermalis (strain DSM 15212 / CIP 107654 / DViRD3) TaxID=1121301 RepID=A0A1M6L7N6_PARC5|nr:putative motility protein [Paramaledivibacter caminithermalis]SHJ67187.1 Putative motility protein [Paramaledivibacter caminithermalis DSM 15212]